MYACTQAFEMADMLEGKAPLDDVPAGLQKYMATVGLTSLPPTVATQVKAGKGGALQVGACQVEPGRAIT
jgi:hypothetical protein